MFDENEDVASRYAVPKPAFFGATNGNGTLEVIVQQIQEIGPGQWLRLMAGIVALNLPAQSQSASSG